MGLPPEVQAPVPGFFPQPFLSFSPTTQPRRLVMRSNVKNARALTHEGGSTNPGTPGQQLRRAVMACMLFEETFYEPGNAHAARVAELCKRVSFAQLAEAAVDARERFKLRHAPLLLVR